jgi:hypothetical protein
VPTLLRYDKSDASKFDWGASLGQHNDNIVGVKLLLDPKQRRPHYLPAEKISRNVKSLPKPPIEVAADFIRAIHAHALAEISRTVPQAYMDMCRKDYILSGERK